MADLTEGFERCATCRWWDVSEEAREDAVANGGEAVCRGLDPASDGIHALFLSTDSRDTCSRYYRFDRRCVLRPDVCPGCIEAIAILDLFFYDAQHYELPPEFLKKYHDAVKKAYGEEG